MKRLAPIIILLLSISCNNKTSIPSYNSFESGLDSIDLYLSDILDNITITPLENNDSIYVSVYYTAANDKYLIVGDEVRICLYNIVTGKYIKTLLEKGNGPNEFTDIGSLAILDDKLYISDENKNFIYTYDLLNSSLTQSPKIKQDPIYLYASPHNNQLYLFTDSLFIGSLNTQTGVIEQSIKNQPLLLNSSYQGMPSWVNLDITGCNIGCYNNNIYIHNGNYSDTVYSFINEILTPFIVLKRNKIEDLSKGEDFVMPIFLDNKYTIAMNRMITLIPNKGGTINFKNSVLINNNTRKMNLLNNLIISDDIPIKLQNGYLYFINYCGYYQTNSHKYFLIESSTIKDEISRLLNNVNITDSQRRYLINLDNTISDDGNPVLISGKNK